MTSGSTYDPTKGVKTDLTSLLVKFSEKESVRFEDFISIWKEMKFSYFSAGRKTDNERREFFEEVNAIALSFYLPPYNFQTRVGGLYLLYGLYSIQTCNPKVPIRVTYESWQQIEEFQESALSQQHYDVDYVFQKLFVQKAFMFVATFKERGRDPLKSSADVDSMKESFGVSSSFVSEVFTSEVLQQLQAIHTQYQQLKLGIAGPQAVRLDRALDVVDDDVIRNIQEQLSQHKEKTQKIKSSKRERPGRKRDDKTQPNMTDSQTEDDDGDPDYCPSEKSGQARVKARAYAQTAKMSKSRRHRTVKVQDPSSSSSPEKAAGNRKRKRKIETNHESKQEVIEEPASETQEDQSDNIFSMPTFVVDSSSKRKKSEDTLSPTDEVKKKIPTKGKKGQVKEKSNKGGSSKNKTITSVPSEDKVPERSKVTRTESETTKPSTSTTASVEDESNCMEPFSPLVSSTTQGGKKQSKSVKGKGKGKTGPRTKATLSPINKGKKRKMSGKKGKDSTEPCSKTKKTLTDDAPPTASIKKKLKTCSPNKKSPKKEKHNVKIAFKPM